MWVAAAWAVVSVVADSTVVVAVASMAAVEAADSTAVAVVTGKVS
jgi:hypothetical protein